MKWATAIVLSMASLPGFGDDYFAEDVGTAAETQFASNSMSTENAFVLPDQAGEVIDEGETGVWMDSAHSKACQSGHCEDSACVGACKDPGRPRKPKHPRPGDIDEGDCPSKRYRMDDCARSGDPNSLYRWAVPSITPKYSAWYVGGGAALKGRGRKASEGTWGLDYDGLFGHARTWLNYTCGKKQGGEGAYETDHVPLKNKSLR